MILMTSVEVRLETYDEENELSTLTQKRIISTEQSTVAEPQSILLLNLFQMNGEPNKIIQAHLLFEIQVKA